MQIIFRCKKFDNFEIFFPIIVENSISVYTYKIVKRCAQTQVCTVMRRII